MARSDAPRWRRVEGAALPVSARVVVVGGGLAGLAAALRLATRGVEVVLFERQPTLGGKAGEIVVDGFRFDTGPTLLTLPDVVRRTFADAGGGAPALEPVDPLMRTVLPSGRVWEVWRDAERSAAGLTPRQGRVYLDLLEETRRLFDGAAPTFVYGPKPGPAALLRYALTHGRTAHPFLGMAQLVRRRGAAADLEAFFLRFATYAGADPYRAPAVLLNIAWAELGLGAVRLDGGTHALVRALARAASARGVRLCAGTEVEGLVVEGGRVRAARAAGATLEVDAVVSAADRIVSYGLAGRRRPPATPPSTSGFVLLLGVEGRDSGGPLHSVLFPRDYRAEFDDLGQGRLPADPTLYLHVSVRAGGSDAPPGHENWFVLVNAPPLPGGGGVDPLAAALPPASGFVAPELPPLLDAAGSPATAAESAYAARVLEALEARAGLERRRLRFWRLVGPRQLAATGWGGSIYGAAPVGLLGALRPSPRVPGVRNLALAGGTVHPGGGIPLALLSGRHAADAVIGHTSGAAPARAR